MSEKLLDILKPQGHCLPEGVLVSYAAGKLALAEARRVEEHLSECEFCSDALDGIMQSGNARQFHEQLTSVKKIIHKKVKHAEAPGTFPVTRTLAVAATLLLIAVSAWYVQYAVNSSSQRIFSEEFKAYPAPYGVLIQPPALRMNGSQDQTGKSLSVKNKKDINANGKSSIISSEPGDRVQLMEKNAPASAVGEQESENNTDLADRSLIQPERGVAKSVGGNAPYSSKVSDADNEFVKAHLSTAFFLYERQHYSEAIAEFRMVLLKDPNHDDANFYSGVSSLALNNSSEALTFFQKTDGEINKYLEPSLWYEALCFINVNDKTHAKAILIKLAAMNGDYSEKAQDLLKQF